MGTNGTSFLIMLHVNILPMTMFTNESIMVSMKYDSTVTMTTDITAISVTTDIR